MPKTVEQDIPTIIQSHEVRFIRPFGPRSSLAETAYAMRRIFEVSGLLAANVSHVVRHEPDSVKSSLGILDQKFDVRSNRESNWRFGRYNVAPMGASREILLGCISLSELRTAHGLPDNVPRSPLFGVVVPREYHDFGYVTLKTGSVNPGGFGYIAIQGRATAFQERPSDDQLYDLITEETPFPMHASPYPISRFDLTKEQAVREAEKANYKLTY